MKRLGKCLVMPLLLSLILTGCWDKRNMEDRSYVITMGIDKYQGERHDCYTLSLGSAELSALSEDSQEEGDISAIQVEGKTIAEAIHQADCFHSRKMYLGQLKTVIFGQNILKDKELFLNILDELERNPDVSEKIILLVAKGSAADCVKVVLNEDSSTGLFIWDFYKNTVQDVAITEKKDLETFMMELRNSDGQSILPQIEIEQNKIRFGGGVGIADYVMCGNLTDEQERGALLLKEKGSGGVYVGNWGKNNIPFSVSDNQCRFQFEKKDNDIQCHIHVKVKGNIEGKGYFHQSFFNTEVMSQLEALFSEIIQAEIESTIQVAQQVYGKDILNFGGKLYQDNPELYRQCQGDNNRIFEEMKFDVQVETKIQSIGVIQ